MAVKTERVSGEAIRSAENRPGYGLISEHHSMLGLTWNDIQKLGRLNGNN